MQISRKLTEHHEMVNELFHRLTAGIGDRSSNAKTDLSFFEGAWKTDTQTHAYCSIRDGQPKIVYCYAGNAEATGEYYDLKRYGDEIFGRFRWFQGGLRGFAWFKIDDPDRLTGAWWLKEFGAELMPGKIDLQKRLSSMNSAVWTRNPVSEFPDWAKLLLQTPPG